MLPCQLGLHSEAEEFCRNRLRNNHREGGEVFTWNEMRSGGSTCAVEAVHLLKDDAGLWLLEHMQTWRNIPGSVQHFRKEHLKVISWPLNGDQVGHFPPMFLLSALEQASLCSVDKWGLDTCIFLLGFCCGFSWDVYLHVAVIGLHILHRVSAMDCVAVLTRKNAFLSSIFFLSAWKWEGEFGKIWLCFIVICSLIVEAVW